MNKTTITINGRLYDATTGQPIESARPHAPAKRTPQTKPNKPAQHKAFNDIGPRQAKPATQPSTAPKTAKTISRSSNQPAAHSMHQRTQKSQTLYRKALKKPVPEEPKATERSPLIKKFADRQLAHVQNTEPTEVKPQQQAESLAPAQAHPKVVQAMNLQHQNMAAASQPHPNGKELKEKLIKERLAEVGGDKPKKGKGSWLSRQPRLVTILTTTLALLVLGGYLTYMTLPSISMQIAASRAGVSDATIPNYKPDGYSLNGPISYSPGEIVINYKSNTADNTFQLTQKVSNWDSQALLDNYITKQTENYLTFQERGLTIYTFENNAAWVNGGLLYTVKGNARLSSEQILRVATSM